MIRSLSSITGHVFVVNAFGGFFFFYRDAGIISHLLNFLIL